MEGGVEGVGCGRCEKVFLENHQFFHPSTSSKNHSFFFLFLSFSHQDRHIHIDTHIDTHHTHTGRGLLLLLLSLMGGGVFRISCCFGWFGS